MINNQNRNLTLGGVALGVSLLATVLTPNQSLAAIFNVNRSWTDGVNNASLVGTVDIPLGNYTLTQGSANPFTSVALTLTTPGGTFSLDGANNSITGTGQFLITANSTSLIFNTANANETNVAYLLFAESGTDRYVIGTDGSPGFEVSITGTFLPASVAFPTTFGTAATTETVPEPSSMIALAVLGGSLLLGKRRMS